MKPPPTRIVLRSFILCAATAASIDDFINLDPRASNFGQPVLPDASGGSASTRPLWTVNWTSSSATGLISTSSDCASAGACVASVDVSPLQRSASLTWSGLTVADDAPPATVSIEATLTDDGGEGGATFSVSMVPTFSVGSSSSGGAARGAINASSSLALYSWELSFAVSASALGSDNDSLNIFLPTGFGILSRGAGALPATSASNDYPASAAMQYQACYWSSGYVRGTSGLYVGAHDPNGSSKTLSYWAGDDDNDGPLVFGVSALVPDAAVALGSSNYSSSHSANNNHTNNNSSSNGAGASASAPSFTVPWPVVLAGIPAGGDWYDAAMIYRAWAVSHAVWTADGPRRLPAWYRDVQTFVNSHWQQLDIFNVTGGEPAVVRRRVGNLTARLGLAPGQLALHWYEWDTLGYTSAADGGVNSLEPATRRLLKITLNETTLTQFAFACASRVLIDGVRWALRPRGGPLRLRHVLREFVSYSIDQSSNQSTNSMIAS